MMNNHVYLLLMATLALPGSGCSSKSSCERACARIAECTASVNKSEQPCELSAQCTREEECLGACLSSAPCNAITGEDPEAVLVLMSCREKCAEVMVLDGGLRPLGDRGGDLPSGADARPDLRPTDGGARERRVDLSIPADLQPWPDQAAPQDFWTPDQTLKLDQGADQRVNPSLWVTVTGGVFMMGSPTSELCREPTASKETEHQVSLGHSFQIMPTEVTQGQFFARMGYNPSATVFCGSDCPADMVTWHEAAAYNNAVSATKSLDQCYLDSGSGALCGVDGDCPVSGEVCIKNNCSFYEVSPAYVGGSLSIQDCPGYRLPTEAEWEFAYRAGTQGATYNGAITVCDGVDPVAESIGWYNANSVGKAKPVGLLSPNSLGLYDMAGNLWEWTNDWYHNDLGSDPAVDPAGPVGGTAKVTRGGAWSRTPDELRAGFRGHAGPTNRGGNRGFRCVRTL